MTNDLRPLAAGEHIDLVLHGMTVRVEHITDADSGHALRLGGVDCNLEGEQPGLYYPTAIGGRS